MPQPNATGKRLLSVTEYMATYGHGRTKLYELLNSGKLEAVKSGARTFITVESAEAHVASLPKYREARAA